MKAQTNIYKYMACIWTEISKAKNINQLKKGTCENHALLSSFVITSGSLHTISKTAWLLHPKYPTKHTKFAAKENNESVL